MTAKKSNKTKKKQSRTIKSRCSHFFQHTLWTNRSIVGKVGVILTSLVVLAVATSYGVAQWYILRHKDEPLTIGATFIPNYAEYLGVDPEETMQAMIDDLGIKRFRLVSYWKDHEPEPDQYNFDKLDWQFEKVEAAGGQIALAIGLRQPRWPECHGPEWAMEKTVPEWTEDLKEYMGVVIDRYKDSPALVEYQLENEFFLSVFGECPDFTRERLVDEFTFVKSISGDTPVTISRSNNALGIPVNDPLPDSSAVSIYKRVWDKTITKRYFEYPFPAWFYGSLAGWGELVNDTDLYVHELQTEAWLAEGFSMKDAPIEELYKTLNPDRLKHRINYGVASGMRTIDVWGVEWWYQMKTMRDAPEIWETAKEELGRYR